MTIDMNSFINYYEKNINKVPQTIFEIGAREANDSIGFKNRYPQSIVYAFEAHPDCYLAHYDNVIKNNVNYYNIGMWDKETEIVFYDKNISSGISSFRNRGDQYGTNKFILKTSTPLKFVNEKNIKSIDILKIDVEGCTYEILQGFGDFIKNIKLMHIETERHQHFEGQYTEDKIFELLLNNNFKLLEHSWCCLEQYDSVWINNSIEQDNK